MVLDPTNAAFIQGGVSISACSCDSKNTPSMARCVGCRVSSDGKSITVFVPGSRSAEFLAGIRAGRQIAIVFSQPNTHRTIQLKGNNAAVSPIVTGDAELVQRYVHAFLAEVCPLGFSADAVRALITCDASDLRAITFEVSRAFDQSPGVRAGQPLEQLSRC